MWNRACPLCFARVPRMLVLARSYDFACPACHAPLELSQPSRVGASLGGIFGALLAGYRAFFASGTFKWTLPIVAGALTFAFCSTAFLFFFSDVVVRRKSSADTFPHGKT